MVEFTEQRPLKNIVLFFIACFIGFVSILISLSKAISPPSELDIMIGHYSWYLPEIQVAILTYVFALPLCFIYFLATFFSFNKRTTLDDFLSFKNEENTIVYFIFLFASNSFIFFYGAWYIKLLLFLLLILSPIYAPKICALEFVKSRISKFKLLDNIIGFLLFIVFFLFIVALSPMTVQTPMLLNDYFNIPYEFKNPMTSKNTDFIGYANSNHLLGNHDIYDFRIDNRYAFPSARVGDTAKVQSFLQNQEIKQSDITKIQDALYKRQKPKPMYFYDNQRLYVAGNISDSDKSVLLNLASNQQEKKDLSRLFDETNHTNPYTYFQKKWFIEQYQTRNMQLNTRGGIHHNAFILNAYEQLKLGKPLNKVFMMYGYLNTIVPNKILDVLGNYSMGAYYNLMASFFYLYIALTLIVSYIVFEKNIRHTFLVVSLNISGIFLLEYYAVMMSPGFNPIRHFFDVFVLLFAYQYFKSDKKRYLVLTILSLLIMMLGNLYFGLFMLASWIAVLFFRWLFDKNKSDIMSIAISMLCAAPIVLLSMTGDSDTHSKFLQGTNGTPFADYKMLALLFASFLFYLIFTNFNKVKSPVKYIPLMFTFYMQATLLYLIQCADSSHFYTLMGIMAISIVLLLNYYQNQLNSKNKLYVDILLIILASGLFIFSFAKFNTSALSYHDNFKTAKTYNWDFKKAKFISILNPVYFIDSIDLLKRYSPNQNAIYMISKYDDFLLFFADKYNMVTSYDILNSMQTKQVYEDIAQNLADSKPQYLFVDKDIDRHFEQDLLCSGLLSNYQYNESLWRVLRLKQMQKLFYSVNSKYQKVNCAQLICVYKLKS